MADPVPLNRSALERLESAVAPDADETDREFVQEFNRAVVEELRRYGEVRGELADRDRLVLTVRGRRTGIARPVPMSYLDIEDRLVVVASRGGADQHPQWYLNLLADPQVTVELGGRSWSARAVPTEGADRAHLFARVCERAPHFAGYQARTRRQLPVVELVPDPHAAPR
jgi:deazaflavin-dependent oxidoreductase (nitroreductase family)